MTPRTLWFCRQVMRLDAIPRYGRLYPWDGPGGVKDRLEAADEGRPIPKKVVHWRFMRRGHWGLHLLDKLDLLWPYLDTIQPWKPTDPDVPVR